MTAPVKKEWMHQFAPLKLGAGANLIQTLKRSIALRAKLAQSRQFTLTQRRLIPPLACVRFTKIHFMQGGGMLSFAQKKRVCGVVIDQWVDPRNTVRKVLGVPVHRVPMALIQTIRPLSQRSRSIRAQNFVHAATSSAAQWRAHAMQECTARLR